MVELLKPSEAATELRVSRGSIYTFLRDGRLAGVRLGGQWRISRRALDDAAAGDFAATPPVPVPVADSDRPADRSADVAVDPNSDHPVPSSPPANRGPHPLADWL